MKKLWTALLFGNYFYGLCAVALSIEAGLQQRLGLNDLKFYILLFLATVVYYTKAYVQSEQHVTSHNQRTIWYKQHQKKIQFTQVFFATIIMACIIRIYNQFAIHISLLSTQEICLILPFPFLGLLYYGLENKQNTKLQLRQIGWLKPFIIGFCWAGAVTVYPALYFHITHSQHFHPSFINYLLFLKNFMFVSVLSIMFDIKDYANDFNLELKTFVVKYGLRKTIYFIIVPLTIIGLLSFIAFAISQHFNLIKIGLNLIPFLLILIVADSLQKRKSILFYLIIIDGIMLVKGLCGIIAMSFFS